MTRGIVLSILVFAGILLPALPSAADKPLPPSVEVEEGPFGAAVVMDGVLVPLDAMEIKCDFERYGGPLEIVEAARAGPVDPGQTLVRFDRTHIDRQIEDGAVTLGLARTRFEESEIELAGKVEELRLGLEDARRDHRIAKERLDRFEKVERQLRIDEAEQSMAWSRDSLANQLEELQQLEKMYEEDDLTEETEEIVLRRARRSYELSKQSFEFRKIRHKWFLEQTLPRDHESLRFTLEQRELKLEKATRSFELRKHEVEFQRRKAKSELEEQERKYEELKGDLEQMVLRAPSRGGYAVPGQFRSGKWSGLGENGVRWKPGDKVRSGDVLYTVFEPTRLGVHATLEQKHLADVRPGLPCTLTSSVAPGKTLPAEVEWVADYGEGTKYDVRIALREGHKWFRAGQKVKATVMGASAPVGLSIPVRCVVGKGKKAHVYLLVESGVEKRPVVLGEKIGDRIGIKEGLEAGQRVMRDPPKEGLDGREDAKEAPTKTDEPANDAHETRRKKDAGDKDDGASGKKDADEPDGENLIGRWRGRIHGQDPFPPEGIPVELVVERGDGGELEGMFQGMGQETELSRLEFDPETGEVEFEASEDGTTISGEGRVDGDELTGNWEIPEMGGLQGTFRFERVDDE